MAYPSLRFRPSSIFYTTLDATITGATDPILVVDNSNAPDAPGIISIDNEEIYYAVKGVNEFSTLTRGYNNTTATGHDSGRPVACPISTDLFSKLWDAIEYLKTVIPTSLVTAKGDIIVATGDGAVDNIAVGTDGQVLTADAASTGGVKWGAVQATLSEGLLDKTRHINLSASGAIIPATNGAAQAQTDGTNFSYYALAYDKATDEKAQWMFVVPDAYDGGNVTFNVWAKTTVTTGDVMWVINTIDVADAATFDSALSTSIAFAAKTVDGTAGDVFVASKAADPGWTAGRLAIVELVRDANHESDTADADVSAVMVEIEWEVT